MRPILHHVPIPGARSVITNGREVCGDTEMAPGMLSHFCFTRDEKKDMLNRIKTRMQII